MNYDGEWWCVMTRTKHGDDELWWLVMNSDDEWWSCWLVDDCRWIMMNDEPWWMMLNDDAWCWMMPNDDRRRWMLMDADEMRIVQWWWKMMSDDEWWWWMVMKMKDDEWWCVIMNDDDLWYLNDDLWRHAQNMVRSGGAERTWESFWNSCSTWPIAICIKMRCARVSFVSYCSSKKRAYGMDWIEFRSSTWRRIWHFLLAAL